LTSTVGKSAALAARHARRATVACSQTSSEATVTDSMPPSVLDSCRCVT
jgi:hypothetical protein